jgi:uncharacterized protein (UPF0210 family)
MLISVKLTKLQVSIRSILMAGIAVAKAADEETPEEVKTIHTNYALHNLVTACYHAGLMDKKEYKGYCETFNPMTPPSKDFKTS